MAADDHLLREFERLFNAGELRVVIGVHTVTKTTGDLIGNDPMYARDHIERLEMKVYPREGRVGYVLHIGDVVDGVASGNCVEI